MASPKYIDGVPVSRIFLMLDNPRHEPFDTEAKVIARLCAKENIYPLARDIAKHGLNPLERFALLPLGKGKSKGGLVSYSVAEGNRRMCALKLLNDPELAPANLRKSITKLAENWKPITSVPAAVFSDPEDVELWLDRIHNGPQDGIGRKQWNSEQKQRFDGGNKNKAAQALLDYAQAEKMITPEERVGKLTTVQRFVGNDIFREVIGIDQADPDDIGRMRPKAEFDQLLKRFMRDLVKKELVNSRMNKDEIIQYARPLGSLPGISTKRIETEAIASNGTGKAKNRRLPPDALLFIDPPYFKKGPGLYTSFYKSSDHAALARRVTELDRHWVVTYDDVPEIRALYRSRRQYCFDIGYSLQQKRTGTELLIASKGIRIPEEARDRQVNRPQYRAA